MGIHNTDLKYGSVAKFFHWVIALLIIAAWGVGYYGMSLDYKDPLMRTLFDLHKSVGMAILMLAVIRLCWRLYDVKPRNPSNLSNSMLALAHSVHYLLYAFMFIQPLTGWAMSSAAGYNPSFFGLFMFPSLVTKEPNMAGFYKDLHNSCAYILLALFVLHVAGALYHHLVVKDDTLSRMIK